MSAPTKPRFFNVFLDSDGPIADFLKSLTASGLTADEFKHLPGVYLWLDETPGARKVINSLQFDDKAGNIRVWIATKTPSCSPYAYTEKVLWYRQHFPWLEDRVILTHDKSILGTEDDFLFDDRPHKANAGKFPGTFVFFDENKPLESWKLLHDLVNQRIVTWMQVVDSQINR